VSTTPDFARALWRARITTLDRCRNREVNHGNINHEPEEHVGARTGEIAFRVNNLDAMQKFYEDVIGLPPMTRVPNCEFFKIADGYGGHTQMLALFDRSKRLLRDGRTDFHH
jgi:catechol-2,3-dioxygenase